MSISLVRDNPLTIQVSTTAVISAGSNLAVSDTDYPDSSLTYTITTAPTRGTLLKNGAATSTFTQADLDNNLISYREDQPSNTTMSDGFFFRASDPANNQTATTFFQINITPPPIPVLNAPGSLTTSAGLATAIHGMQIVDNTRHNFRLDISANAGQVIADTGSLGHFLSLTGGAQFINLVLSMLDYIPGASGDDNVTATLTDLTNNTSTTKTIDIQVKAASNFMGIDGPAYGVGTIAGTSGFRNGTVAYGINNAGEIVGSYSDKNGHPTNGFLINDSFRTLNNPFVALDATEPNDVNQFDQIVGSYNGATFTSGTHTFPTFHQGGFLYINGNWTSFESSNLNNGTFVEGINSPGQIVGYRTIGSGNAGQAFIYLAGTYQDIGPAGTKAYGINDAGQIVGTFDPTLASYTPGPPTHGFLYSNGVFSLLDAPNASSTVLRDVNDAGLIVGYLQNDSGTHGFAYSQTTGEWQLVDVPGAASTFIFGVNDLNQIVGSYADANGLMHGFVAPLPPPLPHFAGNIDEWILFNGNWEGSAGPGSHPAGFHVAAVADFTSDGTSDILWQNVSTGAVDLWKMSNGGWAGSVDLGAHPGSGWQIAGAGDFNHDGTNDVLWFNPGSDQTDIWELANGQWGASVQPGPHPLGYQVAGIGDFNRDGTSDVLWFNPATRDVDEWNIANGHWAGSNDIGIYPGAGYQIAGVGDFNNDGTGDVFWYNPNIGATDIWLLQNGKWAASVSPGNHPTGWQVAGIGDFNGDGTSDVLFYNPTTRATEEWIMANGHWAATIDLGVHPGSAQIAGVGDFNGSLTSDVLWHQFV
jgi:probable HAF family extracellular repeat protein